MRLLPPDAPLSITTFRFFVLPRWQINPKKSRRQRSYGASLCGLQLKNTSARKQSKAIIEEGDYRFHENTRDRFQAAAGPRP